LEIAESLFEWQANRCDDPRLEAIQVAGISKILSYITEALRRNRTTRTATSQACHDGIEALFARKPLDPENYHIFTYARGTQPYDPFNL
jgi:hypothetical protein